MEPEKPSDWKLYYEEIWTKLLKILEILHSRRRLLYRYGLCLLASCSTTLLRVTAHPRARLIMALQQ
jgi:hypothetical protein